MSTSELDITPTRFPDVEIRTRRVRLRAYTVDDTLEHMALFDSEPARQWSSEPQPYTYLDARAFCTGGAQSARTQGIGINWAAEEIATGKLLAVVSLNRTNWRARVTEVAAVAGRWAMGRGLTTETLRAVCRWVLVDQRFNRLQITAAEGNRASRLCARTCGFVEEGVLRNAGFTHHGQVDLVVYGLTPADLHRLPPVDYEVRRVFEPAPA